MVNVNCTGGGGYFSDDVTATKANVVKGYKTVTSDSNDEIVEGTMVGVSASDAQKSNTIQGSNLYLRMTNGAHRSNNQTSGYPEVYIPLSTLRTTIGYTDAQKVLTGTTIAGLAGTMTNRGAWSGTLGLSGQVTIPAGYHNGQGKITRTYTTYAPTSNFTPSAKDQTIPTSGKIITADIKCAADVNLIAQNIKNGVSIFGITGTCKGTSHVAYNGSTFSGALSGGMKTGVTVYRIGGPGGNGSVATNAIDGHEKNDIVTSGDLKWSYFSSTYRTDFSESYEGYHSSLITTVPVDLSLFSRVKIYSTQYWYFRDYGEGYSSQSEIKPHLYEYQEDKGRYYPVNTNMSQVYSESSSSGDSSSTGQGYKTTNYVRSYDISSYTGSYYFYLGWGRWYEVKSVNIWSKVTKIEFIV